MIHLERGRSWADMVKMECRQSSRDSRMGEKMKVLGGGGKERVECS